MGFTITASQATIRSLQHMIKVMDFSQQQENISQAFQQAREQAKLKKGERKNKQKTEKASNLLQFLHPVGQAEFNRLPCSTTIGTVRLPRGLTLHFLL